MVEVEIIRTQFLLGAAHTASSELQETNDIVDAILEHQQSRRPSDRNETIRISLSLLYIKALVEGESGRYEEKAELLQVWKQLYLISGSELRAYLQVVNCSYT